jgi:hypothetical protein
MSESGLERHVAGEERGDDVLSLLDAEPCPSPDCAGVLGRESYKDTAAVVCDVCGVPVVRLWGESA